MKLMLVTTGGGIEKSGKPVSDWEIHKENCADVARGMKTRQYNNVVICTASSPERLRQEELDASTREMGYSEDDYRIMPCCKESKQIQLGKAAW